MRTPMTEVAVAGPSSASAPLDVVVTITVKNDPHVVHCIESILDQDYGGAFHVVVSDNDSGDDTYQRLLAAYGNDPRVTIRRTPGSLSESWNAAAKAVAAPIVARLDADAWASPQWLQQLVAPFEDPRVGWTAGAMHARNRDRSIVARYYDNQARAYARRVAPKDGTILSDALPAWNVAYRRDALDKAGYLDPRQGGSEDWDLHKRIHRLGVRGAFVFDAIAYHEHPESFRELFRKTLWHKTDQYQMLLKYGPREVIDVLIGPLFYTGVAVLLVASTAFPPLGLLALALMVLAAAKQALRARREGDDTFYARPLFRLVEGAAGVLGLLRGVRKFGVRRRSVTP